MKTWCIIAFIAFGLIYFLSPIDILPDHLGVPGVVDDILFILFLIYLFRKIIRPESIQNRKFREFTKSFFSKSYSNNPGFGDTRNEQTQTEGGSTDQSTGSPDLDARDPYTVLGIPPGSSKDEIRKAYHGLSKKYHPDMVNHLGAEFRDLAHKKFINIRKAYETLIR
jgi:DnaJ-domain-containing protein 1